MEAGGSANDAPLDLETEWRELDALPVVDTIRTDMWHFWKRRHRRQRRSEQGHAEQLYKECAISSHQRDKTTVHLARGLTLTRQGLVMPTMSSPTFGEWYTHDTSYTDVPLITCCLPCASTCVLPSQKLCSPTSTSCRQLRSTRSPPWRPRSRGATTSTCWRRSRRRLLGRLSMSSACARGWVWRASEPACAREPRPRLLRGRQRRQM